MGPAGETLPNSLLDPLLVDVPPEGAALLSATAAGGFVRVIVTLNMDYRIESELASSAVVLSQRQAIDSAGSALLSRLSVAPESAHRFGRFPYVSLFADQATIRALLADPAVARVVQDVPDRLHMVQSIPLIGADTAWNLGFDGEGYAVAVLDSGTDAGHEFFDDGMGGSAVVVEACFSTSAITATYFSISTCPAGDNPGDEDTQVGPGAAAACDTTDPYLGTDGCDHGTHVAGTVGGRYGPGGLSGVAPGVGIVAVQVFSYFPGEDNPPGPESPCGGENCILTWGTDQIRALEFLLDLIDDEVPEYAGFDLELVAANMSLGGGRNYDYCFNNQLRPVIRELLAQNVATVISAGNNFYPDSVGAPGCVPEAITVGSSDDGSSSTTVDAWSAFSNSNFIVDLAAPGRWITSSVSGGEYATFQGTSMAAPHVAGAWAVLRQANPGASVQEVLDMLQASATTVTDSGGVRQGRINVDLALEVALAPEVVSQPAAPANVAQLANNQYRSSSFFTPDGDGDYVATDFDLGVDHQVTFIGVSGWHHPVLASNWPRNLSHFDWYVYADDGGQPAGHPEDGLDNHVWHLRLDSDDPAVVRRGMELQLDLAAADSSLALGAGHYWLVFHTTSTRSRLTSDDGDRWSWHASTHLADTDQRITPSTLDAWGNVPVSTQGHTDRAFRLRGLPNGSESTPFVLVFTATPGTIELGGGSTLAWSVSGADQVEIRAQGGALVTVSASASGTFPVSPTSTTTYVLTATNANGDSTANRTVTVLLDEAVVDFDRISPPTGTVTATAGDDDVPVLALTASVPSNSRTVRLLGADLRVTVPGTAAGAEIDRSGLGGVNLYYDANGNRQVDSGDTLLGSSSAIGTLGQVSLSFGAGFDVPANSPAALLITYDLADGSAAVPGWSWWAALLLLPPSLLLFRGGRRRLALVTVSLAMLVAACGGGGGGPVPFRYGVELSSVNVVSQPAGIDPVEVSGLPMQGATVSFPRP